MAFLALLKIRIMARAESIRTSRKIQKENLEKTQWIQGESRLSCRKYAAIPDPAKRVKKKRVSILLIYLLISGKLFFLSRSRLDPSEPKLKGMDASPNLFPSEPRKSETPKVVNLGFYRIKKTLREEGFEVVEKADGKITLVLRVKE